MDERQAQIKERAGLDESRLNQEFVEFLKKWGPHLMFGVAALAMAYFGYGRWEQYVEGKRDTAFVALEEALKAGSPTALLSVADTHAGQGSVAFLARNAAAEVHLSAYRTGIPVGETVDPGGKLPEGKTFLTEEQRKDELKAAEALFQSVADQTSKSLDHVFFAVSSLNGLASVAESRGEMDKAKGFYQQIQTLTKDRYENLAAAAGKRIESLNSLATAPKLFNNADLPNPAPANPVVVPAGPMQGTTNTGQQIQVNPDGTVTSPSITGPDGKPIQLTPMKGPPPGMPGSTTPAAAAPAAPAAPATPPATEPAKP